MWQAHLLRFTFKLPSPCRDARSSFKKNGGISDGIKKWTSESIPVLAGPVARARRRIFDRDQWGKSTYAVAISRITLTYLQEYNGRYVFKNKGEI